MKIEKEFSDDHQVALKVELEPETFESAKRRAAKRISKKVKIAGFRPGKAPYQVVLKQVGEAAVVEDAVDIVLEDVYPKIIEEAEVDPWGPGSLKNIPSMDPPTFEFEVPLSPTVTLGDYKAIKVELLEKKVTNKDVNKVIDNLRDQQAVIEPAERPVEHGDMVYIMLSGERENPKEGEEKEILKERRFPVVVEMEGTKDETEWPFPGFSQHLVGLAAGDEKTIKHKFAKDYELEDLQGVKAEYKLKVEEVKSRTLPEADDEFAKTIGDYESAEDMRADARKNLEMRFEQDAKNEHETKIIDLLLADSAIKYPPQMLDEEIKHYVHDLEHRLSQQGLNLELYLQSRNMDIEALHEEVKPSAEERMKRGLILMELAKAEEITIQPEELEQKTQEFIQQLSAVYPPEEVQRVTRGEAMQSIVSRILSDEITERTLTRLSRIARGLPATDEESEIAKDSDKGENLEPQTDDEPVNEEPSEPDENPIEETQSGDQ